MAQLSTASPSLRGLFNFTRRSRGRHGMKPMPRVRLSLSWMVESGPYGSHGNRKPADLYLRYLVETAPRVSARHNLPTDVVPLVWTVIGRQEDDHDMILFELPAPFTGHDEDDFLSVFTPPRHAGTGRQVNWLSEIPVEPEGFVTPATGFRPGPLTKILDLRQLGLAAGLEVPRSLALRLRPRAALPVL